MTSISQTKRLKTLATTAAFILLIGVFGGMDRGTIPMTYGSIASLALMGLLYARGKEQDHERA